MVLGVPEAWKDLECLRVQVDPDRAGLANQAGQGASTARGLADLAVGLDRVSWEDRVALMARAGSVAQARMASEGQDLAVRLAPAVSEDLDWVAPVLALAANISLGPKGHGGDQGRCSHGLIFRVNI